MYQPSSLLLSHVLLPVSIITNHNNAASFCLTLYMHLSCWESYQSWCVWFKQMIVLYFQ